MALLSTEDVAPTTNAALPAREAPLRVMACATALGAALINAAAIGSTGGDRSMSLLLTFAAMFAVAWGVTTWARPSRLVLGIGGAAHLGFVVFYVVSHTVGVSFIDSLSPAPSVTTPGLLATFFEVGVVLTTGALLLAARSETGRIFGARSWAIAGLVAVMCVPGLLDAGSTVVNASERGPSGGDVAAGVVTSPSSSSLATTTTTSPPKPFDPTEPVDLSGTPGVTPAEQARAEDLLRRTLDKLPKFSDPATATVAGYRSIGDASTGHEHFLKWSSINDSTILDPDHPEALVYNTLGGGRVLEAAMFILPSSYTLENTPDLGGPLTQWHIHDNLCFTSGDEPVLAGLTDSNGNCSNGLVKLPPAPMVHVWIKPNACGPFAALEGIGAGQVKAGETRSCDHVHSSTGF